jgi:hypothetical protein
MRQFLVLTFILGAVISAANFALQTRGYLLLYRSLNELQFNLYDMSLRNDTVNGPNLSVQLKITNPVAYSGLEVADVDIQVYFVSRNYTLLHDYPIIERFPLHANLGPQSSLIWPVIVRLIPSQFASISSFKTAHNNTAIAPTNVFVIVSSLLLYRTGNIGQYSLRDNLTVT